MMGLPSANTVAIVALAAMACVTDLRTRRVPNWLTLTGALTAIAFSVATEGVPGLGRALGGGVIGLCSFLPLFLLGGMGAGDVKLLAAIGMWLGPANAAWAALYGAVAGGALAVTVALSHGYLGKAFRNLWSLFAFWRVSGVRPCPGLTLQATSGPRLPYAVAIGVGALVTLWLR